MVNTPIPHSLKSEARKAAKILKEFTMPSARVGPDKIIPAGLVENAAGLAILTVAKVGFLFTARGGSGIVIARLSDGSWSAPSAIGIAGLGGGLELGAEVTDFIIILNKPSAVDAFSLGGNLTLGGNFTIAAGPMGRNVEGDVSVRSPAAIYTYSKTKGLFAGVSIEGSALIERKDANKKFYARPGIRAMDILTGKEPRPEACQELYDVLARHREMFLKAAAAQAKSYAKREVEKQADRRGYGGLISKVKSIKKTKTKTTTKTTVTRSASGTTLHQTTEDKYASTQFCDSSDEEDIADGRGYGYNAPGPMRRTQSAKSRPIGSQSGDHPISSQGSRSGHRVQAIWAFQGQLPCDLSFFPGDEIEVLTKTATQEDWWEGCLNGRVGIFPANFTKLM